MSNTPALNDALHAGRISKQAYLAARAQQAEEEADDIIKHSPAARALQHEQGWDDRTLNRPRQRRKYHP